MTDYGTIKVPRQKYEEHNERRKDMGLSWAEYLDGQAPESNAEGLGIDDIKNAVRSAVRDEMPEQAYH